MICKLFRESVNDFILEYYVLFKTIYVVLDSDHTRLRLIHVVLGSDSYILHFITHFELLKRT